MAREDSLTLEIGIQSILGIFYENSPFILNGRGTDFTMS
jgi:hypothetical protein